MAIVLNDVRIRGAVAGGLGGFAGWILVEPIVVPMLDRVTVSRDMAELYRVDAFFGALAGVCIGLALGVAEGIILRSLERAGRGALIGGLVGLIGGAIGLVIGEAVYQPLQSCCFIGRSLGWGAFGVILGLAEGVTRRSVRGARSAALGGAIGGTVGGFAFDLVGMILGVVSSEGTASRAVALTIVGACIGLFIVIMERALADGWLKVTSGRHEGREFFLDKPTLTVGSEERADIVLFGDSQVRPRHATIRQEGGEYVIEVNPGASLQVNKQPMSRHALQHGDTLLVGNTRLYYRVRKTAAGQVPDSPSVSAPSPVHQPPVPPAATLSPAAQPTALVNLRTGYRYPLQAGVVVTVGRHPQNSIVLDGVTVSGFHAEVRFENGRWILYDRGSSNGTFVNQRRILNPHMLKPGFQVQIGDTVLQVE